jgi:4-hydroxythreonine-4-phosphate dehydrogenase
MNAVTLVITPGDPEGIGPEVTAKALHRLGPTLKKTEVVIVGARAPFRRYKKILANLDLRFVEPPSRSGPGYQSGWAIEIATQFVLAAPGSRVLVTGPISKERLQGAGFRFKGHTDFLAHLSNSGPVTMMLSNELFRVALVTNHCPLSEVGKRITRPALETTLRHALAFCETDLGIKRPRIAVMGLNPHAGEGGLLGKEETEVIIPALKALSKRFPRAKIDGPHPSDSFFAIEARRPKKDRHDLILALYHDQGLIPVKLSDFSRSMNMTLGLPFVRTSVDHGTAFDIAGKNKADAGSMIYAIEKALEYIKTRRKA